MTSSHMMYEPRVLGYPEALATLSKSLGVTAAGGDTPSDDLLAESIRGTLIGLSCPGDSSSEWEPVYVARLTNAVHRRLASLWPGQAASNSQDGGANSPTGQNESPDAVRR